MREEAPDKRTQLANAVASFIGRYRTVLLVIAGAIVVTLIVLFVALAVRDNRLTTSYTQIEALQDDVAAWVADGGSGTGSDEDDAGDAERAATGQELIERAEELQASYAGSYAAARSAMLRGQIHEQLEQWAEAGEAYAKVAEVEPESYLAPIGLMLASVSYENAEMADEAVIVLERIVDEYGESSADAPRALFSLGRISETSGDLATAAARYNEVIDRYPSSSWTNFARDRILLLTAQGRIGE